MNDMDDAASNDKLAALTILQEHMQGDIQQLLELVTAQQVSIAKIPAIERDVADMKADIGVIKIALTKTNHQIQDHEQRITRLEAQGA